MHARRVTILFAQPVTAAPPVEAGITLVSCRDREWVLDVAGPLGPVVASLAGLPVADICYSTPTLEEIVLGLFVDSAEPRGTAGSLPPSPGQQGTRRGTRPSGELAC
jgi:hypothetical protein